ncbi:MAG: helix-turn-helix transcriptional regulator [Terracidiphilus sp.]
MSFCGKLTWTSNRFFGLAMSSFGEDLRTERLSRGIALKDITAVTKISHQYLEALEQERFRLLPGGILSKGIVRGYAGALGLDQCAWTERFLKAYVASGQMLDDDRSWMEFASNVGKARLLRSEARETRLRWIGVILLLLVGAAAACLAVRYIGLRAGWWPTLLPMHLGSAHFALASICAPPAHKDGVLNRMNAVLRAYVEAQKHGT